MFGSGMGESDIHSRFNVPTLLVGRGAGLYKGDTYVTAQKNTPLANFLLDLAGKFGVEQERFGVSTSRLEVA
jgi:hypothetical protein